MVAILFNGAEPVNKLSTPLPTEKKKKTKKKKKKKKKT